jgi:mercuric ion binding protein
MIKLFYLFLGLMLLASCKNEASQHMSDSANELAVAEDLKKVDVEIEGMTCEIGCARLIESKLAKAKGVNFVKVDFEKKMGRIEYDANVISEKDLANIIASAGGGDLYKVVGMSVVQ